MEGVTSASKFSNKMLLTKTVKNHVCLRYFRQFKIDFKSLVLSDSADIVSL